MNALGLSRLLRATGKSLNTCVRIVLLCGVLFGLPAVLAQNASAAETSVSPMLTNAQQVVEFRGAYSSTNAARIRGVVTYPGGGTRALFLQDGAAGLRVYYTNSNYRPVSGELIEAEGLVGAGLFTPFIDRAEVRVLGSAPMPQPVVVSAAGMAAGEHFGQWVQLEGVVRDVFKDPVQAMLFVSSEGMRFHAVIQPYHAETLPTELLDACLTLRGVCWTEVNAENQPIGFTLCIPGTNYLTVLSQGSRNPFSQPTLPVKGNLALRCQSDNRLKVSGVLAYHSPKGFLYLESEGTPVQARLLVPLARGYPQAQYVERPAFEPLRPGEQVEVVGAPTTALFAPLLQDAEFRRLGPGSPPAATPVSANEALSGRHDGRLVSLKARLLTYDNQHAKARGSQVLVLRADETIFEARYDDDRTNSFPVLARNSFVEATGICTVQADSLKQVRSFRLLLRDAGDLKLLGRNAWWLVLPTGRILGFVTALGVGALIWVWVLRRQVSLRTAELQTEAAQRRRTETDLKATQSELLRALAQEKKLSELKTDFVNVVSHEFRTPLGIILSAAENLQDYFDRLKPEQRQSQLKNITQATRHMAKLMEEVLLLGKVEAGGMDFKPTTLDLAVFCQRVIGQVESATASRCPIRFRPDNLPPARGDEVLLRHILINLLANAVKYSKEGTPVEFAVERRNGESIFRVQDHGIGIPAADQERLFKTFQRGRNAGDVPGTGLGLVIVKRCVDLHGGSINFESTEGVGTTFTVTLPLFGEQAAAAIHHPSSTVHHPLI